MENCIFCKIVQGEIPAHKIYEDGFSIGILDLFPNTEGQCLIISKKHYPSDFTAMPAKDFQEFVLSAQKLSDLLKEKLAVKMVSLVIEGTGVNHAHIKLYPMQGLKEGDRPTESLPRIFYEKYPGFIDTRSGEKANEENLQEIAKKLRSK